MKHFLFTVSSSAGQAECLEKLRIAGMEVIQTASGLCVKTDQTGEALETLTGLKPEEVGANRQDLSPDIRAFLEKKS